LISFDTIATMSETRTSKRPRIPSRRFEEEEYILSRTTLRQPRSSSSSTSTVTTTPLSPPPEREIESDEDEASVLPTNDDAIDELLQSEEEEVEEEEEEEVENPQPSSKAKRVKETEFPDELKNEGFRIGLSPTFHPPIFPQDHISGPKNVPPGEITESTAFHLFFDTIVEHILNSTNDKLKQQNVQFEGKLFQITGQMLLDYIAIRFAWGLVPYRQRRDPWRVVTSHVGLFGNQFFRETLAYNKWELIDRWLNADLDTLVGLLNSTLRRNWTPFQTVCFDDDVTRWTGKGGAKVKIQKKADPTGLLSWRIVDDHYYP